MSAKIKTVRRNAIAATIRYNSTGDITGISAGGFGEGKALDDLLAVAYLIASGAPAPDDVQIEEREVTESPSEASKDVD